MSREVRPPEKMEVHVKKKRFTEDPIVHALAQKSAGQTITEIYRRLGVAEQTFYQKKFGADPHATASRELVSQPQVHGASHR